MPRNATAFHIATQAGESISFMVWQVRKSSKAVKNGMMTSERESRNMKEDLSVFT